MNFQKLEQRGIIVNNKNIMGVSYNSETILLYIKLDIEYLAKYRR